MEFAPENKMAKLPTCDGIPSNPTCKNKMGLMSYKTEKGIRKVLCNQCIRILEAQRIARKNLDKRMKNNCRNCK